MLVFERPGQPSRCVLLFGVGLIGSTVWQSLATGGWAVAGTMPYAWNDPDTQRSQAQGFVDHVSVRFDVDGPGARVDVVWAAGKAGFDADWPVLDKEWTSFEIMLTAAQALARRHQGCRVNFHLLSSAGGLFEGQTFVDAQTQPAPRRNYGKAKLRQEEALAQAEGIGRYFIYRPSSVYGFSPGGRAGLIFAVISNAIHGRVTKIFGSPHTLRDFVLADDIGRFVCSRVGNDEAGSGTHILASAKPTSMFEILSILGNTLRVPLYLRYDTAPSNALNNSYRASALPKTFKPTELSVGVSQTASKLTRSRY